ncbi:retinitis pigmentosa gtpase regulator a-related [Anaeramoeba flamelloides]|uniref:Retinitis pigmentosa gtpase regulator a-related n=1 Tax=Anaeramoeba flamelloides TaxID=1746091 RepID=A0AAV7ZL55_9EUKA|nr:retinitis pigmentosa gtpase regulator a-related [Anaeramoeba flamelloides]
MDIAVPSLKYYNFKNELFQIHTHYSKELKTEEDQDQLQILLKKKENKKFLFESISKITKHYDQLERRPVANDEIYLLFEKRPIIQDKNITFLRNNKELKLDKNRYHFAVGILTEEMKKQIQSSSETESSSEVESNTESDKNKNSEESEESEESNEKKENDDESEESEENEEKNADQIINEEENKDENDDDNEEKEEEIDSVEDMEPTNEIQTPKKKKGGFVNRVMDFAKYLSPWKRGEDNLPKTEQKKKEELEQDLERKRSFQDSSEESEKEEEEEDVDDIVNNDDNLEQVKKRKKIIDN